MATMAPARMATTGKVRWSKRHHAHMGYAFNGSRLFPTRESL